MKRLIDIAMITVVPLLMAYSLIGEATHEWLGIAMTALLIAHHALNRSWYGRLFKGKYGLQRTIMTILDIVLLMLLIAQAVSGVMMAKHTFEFLPHVGRRSLARTVHMTGAYWGFVLMGVHAGLHMGAVLQKLRRYAQGKRAWAFGGCGLALIAYGAYAFVKRQLPQYMFMRIQFAFFDFQEPLICFLLDYACILALFALAGLGISEGMKALRKKRNSSHA